MDNISPLVERRSRRIGPVEQNAEEVPPEELNDDEEERSRYREQLKNDSRNLSTREKHLSVSEKSLSEHFQSCIQLAAENKINAKNAFNFKLIDLLHMMVGNKKQIHDFTEVSSSLDAGVKIYSCRVDNVHSDTMKMATTICSATNKKRDHEEDEADEMTKKKTSKKVQKSTLAINLDQINRSKSDDFGSSHFKLSNNNFIINSALFDNNRMCWHLDVSSKFWKSDIDNVQSKDIGKEVTIKLPDIVDEVICPSFKHFSFTGETNFKDISIKEKLEHMFDYEPPLNNQSMNESVDDFNDKVDVEMNEDFDHQEEPESISTQSSSLSKVMSSSSFVSDITKLIVTEKSEYCYFNTQLLKKKWDIRSMGHWNPFMRKKEIVSKPRNQKKDSINFEETHDLSPFDDDSKLQLTTTTISSRDKYLITPITHFSTKEFFRLKIWREMFVIPSLSTEEQPSDLEENINDYNYNNPNDTQNVVPELYEDDYADNFEDVAADVHQMIDMKNYDDDNLIKIPNKVAKIELPYLVKNKSIDMKKLKSQIWTKIEHSLEINEAVPVHELTFSDICEDLLHDGQDEELSVPILFNAILQLANDKNLQFDCIETKTSDFFVRLSN